MNGPEISDDDVGAALEQAGERLRHVAPDQVAASTAYETRRSLGSAQTTGRSWWPAGIGIGLVAAAIVGIVSFQVADRPDADIETPADTTGTVDTLPSVPLTIAVTTTPPSAQTTTPTPSTTPSTTTSTSETTAGNLPGDPVADPACGTGPTDAGVGQAIIILACRYADGDPVAIAARVPTGSTDIAEATSYFTTSSWGHPGGSELVPPSPIAGAGTRNLLLFRTTIVDGSTCVLLVDPVRNVWKDLCFPSDAPVEQAFTFVDGDLIQLDLATPDEPRIHVLDRAWPSSGCTSDDAFEIGLALGGPDDSASPLVYTGLRCDGDTASVSVSSEIVQPGEPRGRIVILGRSADGRRIVADGQAPVDDLLPFGVPAFDTWTRWPGDTDPIPTAIGPIGDAEDPALDLQDFTDHLVGMVDATYSQDPEFPANAELVALEPDGLPLAVIRHDVGGDDSVGGRVLYFWLHEAIDANGAPSWNWDTVYATQECRRGVSETDRTLCI